MIKRDYRDYVQDILDSMKDTEEFVKGMGFDDFTQDKKTINAVIRSIEVIGEATKKIPESLKDKFPSVPWKKMARMRDKLIHQYFGIDIEILWQVVKKDLPNVKPLILKVRESLEKEKS